MFEAGVVREITAWHAMPHMEGPESKLHSHDYRVEVNVTAPRLDDSGFTIDIDFLRAALNRILDPLDDDDLEKVQEDDDPVTVERFSYWLHRRLRDETAIPPDASLHVRIWEAVDAFGGYSDSNDS